MAELRDDVLGTALAPGASITADVTTVYTIGQDDMDWGKVAAATSGAATGQGGFARPASPDLTIQNLAQSRGLAMRAGVTDDNRDGIEQSGEELIYPFKIINTGNVSIKRPNTNRADGLADDGDQLVWCDGGGLFNGAFRDLVVRCLRRVVCSAGRRVGDDGRRRACRGLLSSMGVYGPAVARAATGPQGTRISGN